MGSLILKLNRTDESALLYVVHRRRPLLDRAVRAVTHLGGATFTILLSLILMTGVAAGFEDVGAHMAFGLVASHLAVQLLKRCICRERPHMPVGVETLIEAPDRFSFPSGHAAAALSLSLPLALAAPAAVGAPAIVAGLLVGVTRCYLGVHYPGDVIAGWLLALTAFIVGTALGF